MARSGLCLFVYSNCVLKEAIDSDLSRFTKPIDLVLKAYNALQAGHSKNFKAGGRVFWLIGTGISRGRDRYSALKGKPFTNNDLGENWRLMRNTFDCTQFNSLFNVFSAFNAFIHTSPKQTVAKDAKCALLNSPILNICAYVRVSGWRCVVFFCNGYAIAPEQKTRYHNANNR